MGLAGDAARARTVSEPAEARIVLAPSPAAALGGDGNGTRPAPAAPPQVAATPAAGSPGRVAEAEAGARAIAAPADVGAARPGAGGLGRTRSSGQRREGTGAFPSRRRSRTPLSMGSREQSRSSTPPQGTTTDNPLDVVFDLLRAATSRPGALVPRRSVELQAAGRGISPEMFQEALENWFSLNLLDWAGYGDEVGLTAEAWCTQTCHLGPKATSEGTCQRELRQARKANRPSVPV